MMQHVTNMNNSDSCFFHNTHILCYVVITKRIIASIELTLLVNITVEITYQFGRSTQNLH